MGKINAQLRATQQKLKAPKGQYNSFAKYKYRSCEDILEAVKPILAEQGLSLTLDDDITEVGGRVYVKATATIANDDGETVVNHGLARESVEKRGMDDSQITGTASSYARKYALNGLFAIDDTKDADTEEYQARTRQGGGRTAYKAKARPTPAQPITCEECGSAVAPMPTRSGGTMTASQVAEWTKSKTGKTLCDACYKLSSSRAMEGEMKHD